METKMNWRDYFVPRTDLSDGATVRRVHDSSSVRRLKLEADKRRQTKSNVRMQGQLNRCIDQHYTTFILLQDTRVTLGYQIYTTFRRYRSD